VVAPFRRARDLMQGQAYGAGGQKEEIWALKDVSFEIKHGEAVGIIGRNGAGKSTLLKILSRITEPTTGYADIYGRVGALLEVGTGFHPELTGRENIYLNGAILGMSRADVQRKFDEIVDFSGVEKFIDTPVKHYSSGMGLRLGFAVAAHLEPEILVVDEVLAVGDAEFQKKCLGKMSDVTGQGRTVLFVSHNMSAVLSLCQKAILLERGQVTKQDKVENVVASYLEGGNKADFENFLAHPGRTTSSQKLIHTAYLSQNGQVVTAAKTNSEISITVEFNADTSDFADGIHFGILFKDKLQNSLFSSNTRQYGYSKPFQPGANSITAVLPSLPLSPGKYGINVYLGNAGRDIDVIKDALELEVLWDSNLGVEIPPKTFWGPIFFPVEWC
jgi:lipopolysaccharide transport system ATP-binding protein